MKRWPGRHQIVDWGRISVKTRKHPPVLNYTCSGTTLVHITSYNDSDMAYNDQILSVRLKYTAAVQFNLDEKPTSFIRILEGLGWVENNEGRFSLLTNATHARLVIVSKIFSYMHDTKDFCPDILELH